MPVSGNEEPGVLARQSSNVSSGIPLKKRRYLMVQPPSPTPVEPSSSYNENESKTKESGTVQRSTLNSGDTTGKSDISKKSVKDVKEERPGANVNCQSTLQTSVSESQKMNSDSSLGSSRNVDVEVKSALAENLGCQEALGTAVVNANDDDVTKQVESDSKVELSADSKHAKLSLAPKEPLVSSLTVQNNEGGLQMADNLNYSSSSTPSLSRDKAISQDGMCKNIINSSDDDNGGANRSKWDLNTTMDAWEGSGDDAPLQDLRHMDSLRRACSAQERKPSISSANVVGASGNKGKQVVRASEQESNFPVSSIHPSLLYKSEDALRLSLGSTFRGLDSSVKQSLAKVDSSRFIPNSSLQKNLALNRNLNSPGCRTIKAEPVEENSKQVGTTNHPAVTLEANLAKMEHTDRQNLQSVECSTKGPRKLVEKKLVKSEPVQEDNQEVCRTLDATLHQSVGRVLQLQESSSTLSMPLTPKKVCPSRLSTGSELSVTGALSTQSEHSVHTKEVTTSKNATDDANAGIASEKAKVDLKELNVSSGKVEASVSEGMDIDDPKMSKFKRVHGSTCDLLASGEGSVSDEEKLNISAATEEECYGSDYESDGNHAFAGHIDAESMQCNREDEEYEDGEVREPIMQSILEDPIAEGMDSEKDSESTKENAQSAGLLGDGKSQCSSYSERVYSMSVHNETNNDFIKGRESTSCDGEANQIDYGDVFLPSPLSVKLETTGRDAKMPVIAPQQESLDQSGEVDVQDGYEKDVACDGATNASRTGKDVGETNDENVGASDMATIVDSSLQTAETSVNANTSKDSSTIGSKSRIINLPRASDVTSPSDLRTITGRSLSSRSGRERYSDMEEEKLYLRGNRDETYADGPKYVRDRIQDRSFGRSRLNFMRGRGRVSDRFDSFHYEWNPERDFASDSYGDGRADYRFRHKRNAAIGESELERNDYDVRLDGAAFASGRGRNSFRHPSSRRLSPSGREGAAMRGNQMLRTVPRNISPSRSSGEDGSELVGLRHSEKFIRDLPADITDPVYSRQQPMHEGQDGHFVRGNRNFTPMQRRGFPRMRSKSPVRARTRSPGPWSSPRRRSTEGFNGLSDLSQHRSSAMYRMRSPDRNYFTDEMVPRRRGSPSYAARPSNDTRDVDSVQEHGHPRSYSSRRSQPDRVFSRNNRRLEVLDRRERGDDDEYFGGSIQTGRFHELGGDGSTDERKKYGERRGLVRSFRPPYNSDNDNFRFHPDDGPNRPFRFCPETDAEFIERSNTREREFDARIKDRPLIAPRRRRNIEEQEGNFRHSGQVWDEVGFDGSRLKRRRF